jgi:hypothetical protein
MIEFVADAKKYLETTQLGKVLLSELTELIRKIEHLDSHITAKEVCEKIILFAEKLIPESAEKNDLHDMLYAHFPEVYLDVIDSAQIRLNVVNALSHLSDDKSIQFDARKKLSTFLAGLNAKSETLSALFIKISSWLKAFEASHNFDLDEDLSWKKRVVEILKQFSPDMDFKLLAFALFCTYYSEEKYILERCLDELTPSEFCSAIYMLLEQKEYASAYSDKNKQELIQKIHEMDKKYLLEKSSSKENESPLQDMNSLVSALNHRLTVRPSYNKMQQVLDDFLTVLSGRENLQYSDIFMSLEAWAGNAQHQTDDQSLKMLLKDFGFKMSLANLLYQQKAGCSTYMIEKIRDGLLGEKKVEVGAKRFAVPQNLSGPDSKLYTAVKLRCRKYLGATQKPSQKNEALNNSLRLK